MTEKETAGVNQRSAVVLVRQNLSSSQKTVLPSPNSMQEAESWRLELTKESTDLATQLSAKNIRSFDGTRMGSHAYHTWRDNIVKEKHAIDEALARVKSWMREWNVARMRDLGELTLVRALAESHAERDRLHAELTTARVRFFNEDPALLDAVIAAMLKEFENGIPNCIRCDGDGTVLDGGTEVACPRCVIDLSAMLRCQRVTVRVSESDS